MKRLDGGFGWVYFSSVLPSWSCGEGRQFVGIRIRNENIFILAVSELEKQVEKRILQASNSCPSHFFIYMPKGNEKGSRLKKVFYMRKWKMISARFFVFPRSLKEENRRNRTKIRKNGITVWEMYYEIYAEVRIKMDVARLQINFVGQFLTQLSYSISAFCGLPV